MTFEAYIEKYVKEQFFKSRDPLEPNYKPNEEDWDRVPAETKKMFMDMFLEMPLLKELNRLYVNKFTEHSFGMIIKAKMKEVLK